MMLSPRDRKIAYIPVSLRGGTQGKRDTFVYMINTSVEACS